MHKNFIAAAIRLQNLFKGGVPLLHNCTHHAGCLCRNNVAFFAHEGPAKCCRLPERTLTKGKIYHPRFDNLLTLIVVGTVGDLLDEFKDQGWISKSAAEAKQLELRIVCEEDRLVRESETCRKIVTNINFHSFRWVYN
jgi:hypothetical protein